MRKTRHPNRRQPLRVKVARRQTPSPVAILASLAGLLLASLLLLGL